MISGLGANAYATAAISLILEKKFGLTEENETRSCKFLIFRSWSVKETKLIVNRLESGLWDEKKRS